MTDLSLLPYPRSLTLELGQYTLESDRRIVLDSAEPQALRFSAQRLQAALREHAGVDWELSATTAGPANEIGALLWIAPDLVAHPQGYRLAITPQGIRAEAATPAGLFYAVSTLIQIIEQAGRHLPCLHIVDWPDFAARGVMLDISRDKVPTIETLRALIDLLAGWKINQIQLYTEHTFAYRNHPEVWADASPITGAEILDLDAYCRQRHVELVPNQNSFGHMERWLKHARYAPLAEAPNGFMDPWGTFHPYSTSVTPGDPRSLDLIRTLFDELLPHFSSRLFNVGCDETLDLGQGSSKEVCAQRGHGRVYLDFLLQIYREVTARGRIMQFWGDIIIEHPELIPELPKDVIALEWGYEANHPFDTRLSHFAAAGVPFFVCPGTSAWRSLAGRTDNAIGNLRSAAMHGLQYGAIGYLNTDWGDAGHWQVLPVSYLGLAVGAASAWALEANQQIDVPRVVSRHAFRDPSGAMGRVAYDLGNIYRLLGQELPNNSLLSRVLERPLSNVRTWLPQHLAMSTSETGEVMTPAMFERAVEAIERAIAPLEQARMDPPDAALIAQEYANTARLMRHACRRALLALDSGQARAAGLSHALDLDMQEIIEEYRRVWLARNRPGGLVDSLARFEVARRDYA